MRNHLKVFLGITAFFVYSIVMATQPITVEEGYRKWRESKSNNERQKLMLDGIISNPTISADSSHSYDAINLDITISSVVWDTVFNASVEMKAVSLENNLGEFDFHLDGCVISEIQVDGITSNYTHEDDYVLVSLPEIMMEGDTLRVLVTYSGRIIEPNNDGGLLNVGGLFTFGEPYGTRMWLACYDFPFDKVTSKMTMIFPDHYDALSNGYLVEEIDLGNGRKRTVWQNDDPVSTYLISLVARDYDIIDDGVYGVNNTPVKFWLYPDFVDVGSYDLGRTGQMLEYYESLFGPYPFNKYDTGMAYIFGGWGAMEHQTCTTMGTWLIRWGDRRFERIVAHELAHQWWGDYVGPLSFRDIWLNEGFATYSEPLWDEYFSDEQRNEAIQGLKDSYFNDDARSRFALYNPPYDPENGIDELFSGTVYDKGGLVLHVLRWIIGDEAFFDGLRYYVEQHAFGSATTAEFQENMEHISGMDLSDFFSEWIYQAGYPEYLLDDYQAETNSDLTNVSFTIFQTQNDAPLFSTPVPIYFTNGVLDTLVRFEMEAEAQQTLSVNNLLFEPTSVRFDPVGWILCTADDSRANVEEPVLTISDFTLSAPWPNPFNSSTSMRFNLPADGFVSINVFDIMGREVAALVNREIEAGNHRFTWQPDLSVASGTYLINAHAGDRTIHKKVILLK